MKAFTINIADWQINISDPLVVAFSVLLLVSLLMTLRLAWNRLQSRSTGRAITVITLNLLAYMAVLALLTEPKQMQKVNHRIALITEGTTIDAQSWPAGTDLYIAPEVPFDKTIPTATWLQNIAQMELRDTALTRINVSGYGLQTNQWRSLSNDLFITFEPPDVNGFTHMHWPRRLVMGQPLMLSGQFTWHDAANSRDLAVIELRLLDPADKLTHQARIKNGAPFTLSARPKTRGNLSYRLQAWSGDQLLSEQQVSLSVVSTSALRLLIQQSAPSFETRQLKNLAAIQNASVLINTVISKDKTISQLINLPEDTQTAFSPGVLAKQDMVIMDGRAYIALTSQQRQWLTAAVKQGLGILLLADTPLREALGTMNSSLLKDFDLLTKADAGQEIVPRLLNHRQINERQINERQPLPVATMQLRNNGATAELLVDDEHGEALVINQSIGLGHVAIGLITSSHQWLTAGHTTLWSDYWSTLIATVSKPRENNYLLAQPGTTFHLPGERIQICTLTSTEGLRASISPPDQPAFEIELASNSMGSPKHCGWFWSQSSGWHQIKLLDSGTETTPSTILDQQGLMVLDDKQWLSQRRQQRVNATLKRVATQETGNTKAETGKWISEPINTFWLWILFVISASLLWLERKLDTE